MDRQVRPNKHGPHMDIAKPTTAWAYASLACCVLGLLPALPLPFIDYQQIAGATAGVGIIGPLLFGMASALLAMIGLFCGLIALARIGSGRFGGLLPAWIGVVLSGMLLLAYLVVSWLLFFGGGFPDLFG